MLTGFDDYPIHQTALPVAATASSDVNHYDRYFFNGYSSTGDLYFAVAMGLYPNRHVADAAFSVIHGGEQISVFGSRRAPADRLASLTVAPIHVEVLKPLHQLRVVVDSPEHGLAADVTFTSRSAPIEEPHFFLRAGQRVVFDYTRLTQFGSWAGWVEIDGERIQLGQVELPVLGSRDRSWGVRPVGEPAPLGAPVMEPQFFWLWAPVNFPTLSTHFDVNERGDGTRWHQVGALAPLGSAAALVDTIEWSVSWRPGSRWADHFEYRLVDQNGGSHTVRLTPRYEFMMSGLGYGHPSRGHGVWQGEEVIAGERMMLPVATPCDRQHVHVQALCDATYSGPCGESEQGVGILEQLAIGPHPSGLNGVLEPYAPTLRCDERSYHHRQE